MGRNNGDFHGLPDHKSVTMMTANEIVKTATYDDSTKKLDKENKKSKLKKKIDKPGYNWMHDDPNDPEAKPITITYPKDGKPEISDGNHRVRMFSKIDPNKKLPVLHIREDKRYGKK